MPSTNSIRSGVAPVRGSVGRLRVDAPVEAFGGGRGLSQVGAGVSNLGGGVRAAGEAQERRQADQDAQAERVRNAYAKQQLASRKVEFDSVVLKYKMKRQEDTANLKQSKGVSSNGSVDKYDALGKKDIDEILAQYPEASDVEKAKLRERLMESDMSNRKSLFEHQGTQISKAAKETRVANKAQLSGQMVERRDNMKVFGDNLQEWIGQFEGDSDTAFQGDKIELGVEGGEQRQLEFLKDNTEQAVEAMIGDLQNNEVVGAEAERIKNILGQADELGFETKELRDSLDKRLKNLEKDAQEAVEIADQAVLNDYTDTIRKETTNGGRRDITEAYKKLNPQLAGQVDSISKRWMAPTSDTMQQEWDKMFTMNPDKESMQEALDKEFNKKDSKMGRPYYDRLTKMISQNMSNTKKTIWSETIARLKVLEEEPIKFTKGGTAFKIAMDKESRAAWETIKDVVLDQNVTPSELTEIVNKAFIKPEARMATWSASQRVQWATAAVGVAMQPGVQDLDAEGAFRFAEKSDDELLKEINESMEAESVKKRNEDKAQKEIKEQFGGSSIGPLN